MTFNRNRRTLSRSLAAFSVAACLLLTSVGHAAAEGSAAPATIEQIDQRVIQPQAMEGKFTQKKYLKVLSRPLVSQGYFIVAKQQGIIWQVSDPVASRLVITPDQTRFSEANSERVAKSMQYIGNIFNHLLAGDLSSLQQQFSVEKATMSDTGWQLTLTPKSMLMQKAIASIDIHGNQLIEGLILNEATGDKTEIHFSDLKHYADTPASITRAFN